jgi:hypothetical protein
MLALKAICFVLLVAADPELPSNPFGIPTQLIEPQYRRNLFRLQHRLPPRIREPQSARTESLLLHKPPWDDVARGVNCSCRPTAIRTDEEMLICLSVHGESLCAPRSQPIRKLAAAKGPATAMAIRLKRFRGGREGRMAECGEGVRHWDCTRLQSYDMAAQASCRLGTSPRNGGGVAANEHVDDSLHGPRRKRAPSC